jgi:protein-S-isoprenylcysteine O-methyltransferase Ste14
MDERNLKRAVAPLGVASGITIIMLISVKLADYTGIPLLDQAILFIPPVLFRLIGTCMILIWLPVFIAGFYSLGQRGAVGLAEKLQTGGIYRYLRNPMYAGISCTIIGTGLLLLLTGIVILGFAWLTICSIQYLREEKELTGRFGREYEEYRKTTPRFIPDITRITKDLTGNR